MCKKAVRCGKFFLLLTASIALIMSIVASYLGIGDIQPGRRIGLYEKWNSTVVWSQRGVFTNSTFTPIGWGFNAWIVIYIYQLIVLVHCWTTLCRRAPSGAPLCTDPDLSPAGLLFWHLIASLLNLAWIFLADRVDAYNYLLVPQVCVMFSLAASLVASLISSYYWLLVGKSQLVGRQSAYWLVVVLVQNGISLYAGWAVFASFLNLSVTLSFVGGLPSESASLICLTLLNSIAAGHVVLELTTLDRALRFTFTPHAAIIWASSTALGNGFDGWNLTNILLLLLICILGMGLLLKLIAACVRTRRDPIFPEESYSLEKMFG